MSELKFTEFTEEPSDYLICFNPDSTSDITCVIVEDDPGPYLDFVQDVVQSGLCGTAMTAPFTDSTIQLLQGQEVTFGADSECARMRIPNPQHCVLVLDMRNETEQTFKGYNPKDFAICGYQFFRQLRGFPGKVFFATRYGRRLLEEKGLTGAFGVVPLELKSDYHGPMPAPDKQKLLATLDLALVQCDVSSVYRITRRGDAIDITFQGEVSTLMPGKDGPKKSGLAFMAVVQSGPEGLTDEQIAEQIGYQSRPDSSQDDSEDSSEGDTSPADGIGMTAEDLLPRLLGIVKEGHVPGVDYAELCHRLGLDADSRVSVKAEEVFREVFSLSQEVDTDFTLTDLSLALRGEATPKGEEVLDPDDLSEGYGVTHGLDAPQRITKQIKAYHLAEFVQLNFSAMPRLQAEQEDITAQLHAMRAAAFKRVADAGSDGEVADASQEKDAMKARTSEYKQRLEELDQELKRLRVLRDKAYRIMKSRFKDGQYVALAEPSKIQDYMSRLPRRFAKDLKRDNRPEPEALIEYAARCWLRQTGTHTYTGGEVWQVE